MNSIRGGCCTHTDSIDIYRGKSFNFAGDWAPGRHYANDEYSVDFVSHDNKLWICKESHLSNDGSAPCPDNSFWRLVVEPVNGADGDVYVPSLGTDKQSIIFTKTDDKNLPKNLIFDIRGAKGDKGDKGEQGLQGERGEPGPKGDKGETGTFDQNVIFDELNTNNKSIIGAINELLELISSKDPSEPTPDTTNMMYYGYIPYSVTGDIAEYTDITLNMLQHSDSFIVKEEPKAKDKTSIGSVPEACFIIVAIPASYGLTAKKDSGMGDKVQFSESDFGCNGASVIYNNVEYYLFGEITLVAGERFIYIE